MEITTELSGELTEIRLKGRLDASWCDHVGTAISTVIQNGGHRIHLNMTDVDYMSSAGIRILVTYYKQLHAIGGEFLVVAPSPEVKTVLNLSGLTQLLASSAPSSTTSTPTAQSASSRSKDDRFEIYSIGSESPIAVRLIGQTDKGFSSAIKDGQSVPVTFADSLFGFGLGAIGNSQADCANHLGEFLSIAGASAVLPGDNSNKPDYMLTQGQLVPQLQVAYGIMGDLNFSHLLRFSSKLNEPVGLSKIATTVLSELKTDSAVLAIVAETSALVGASIRLAPHSDTADTFFNFPEVRKNLSFTSERGFQNSVSLIVGVVSRAQNLALSPLLRPLSDDERLQGHFHAAAFSYAPIKKGLIELHTTVRGLFENQSLLGVLHLLNDNRESNGVGESEFIRGACWASPAALTFNLDSKS